MQSSHWPAGMRWLKCFLLSATLTSMAWAERTQCDNQVSYNLKKHRSNISKTASKLLEVLKLHAHRAAIVARAGSELSSENFRRPAKQKYTHVGIAWQNSHNPQWQFTHLINVCEGANSKILVHSLEEFFDDDPHYYDFYVGVPSRKLQGAIADLLANTSRSLALHNSNYSKIANPFKTTYQNSNGWALNIIAAAQSDQRTIAAVLAHYSRANYQPSQVRIAWWRKLFASATMKNVTFRDHKGKNYPPDSWYYFVSAASLYNYIEATDEFIYKEETCHAMGCDIEVSAINSF